MSVNGTNIETNVDGTGRFTLTGVPSGTIVLNFSGRGINASVTLRGVNTGDQIDIEVRLDGNGARLDSEHRRHGEGGGEGENRDADDDDDDEGEEKTLPNGMTEVEGNVANLSGACPALTFRLGTRMVRTSSTTVYEHITCSGMKNAIRIEAIGRLQSDGTLAATGIEGYY